MRRNRQNKSVQVKKILRNVLGDGNFNDESGRNVDTVAKVIGRKQRRRNLKKAKKLKRLNNANCLNSKLDKDELGNHKHGSKQHFGKGKRTDEVKKRSGAMQRKRRKEKLKATKIQQLKEENKGEEKEITALEKLMHMNKAKKKEKKKLPSSFAQDGLDYILNTVSWQDGESDMEDERMKLDESDGDDFSEEDEEDQDIQDCESPQEDISDAEEMERTDNGQVESVLDDKISEIVKDDESTVTIIEEPSQGTAGLKRQTETGKYIPPAQRAQSMKNDGEKRRKIRRQLQGLLNRLSEANLHSICSAVQNVFHVNSRAAVTEDITDLIMEQFCTADPKPEQLIVETAMLLSVLSNNVGVSVVAHFVEVVVKKINHLLGEDNYGKGKETNNLVHILCSLYQLKTIQSKLLTDLVAIFTQKFEERDLELLILIMTQVGFQIRKEDPVTLKQGIENISKASSGANQDADLTRTKYMLEVLTAIKNNNIRKITGYDAELISNRRKKVKVVAKDDSDDFPNVAFQDLLDADIKGRWWIVGSAWTGAPMLGQTKQKQKTDVNANVSSQLMEAARKLRMNTDVRRQIFYAALSSDDYLDAFGNILKLNLKGKQCREIGHVLVECCIQQKSYNPFYYYLLRKFCRHDREFVMSIQCTFWDKFKLLDSLAPHHIKNITSLLAALLVSEDLPLSCLKAIEFSQIDKQMVEFIRNLILKVLDISGDNFATPFVKLAGTKLTATKQGIRLFLQHFMIKDHNFIKLNQQYEERLFELDESLSSGKPFL